MNLRLGLISLTLLVTFAAPAAAHEYGELEPLDADLRSFLISLLEQAAEEGHLDGEPDSFSDAGPSVSARLARVVSTATQADMAWLETVNVEGLDHPLYGRAPAGLILQRLDELVSDVIHFEEHAELGYDAEGAFSQDMQRLERLSSSAWEE